MREIFISCPEIRFLAKPTKRCTTRRYRHRIVRSDSILIRYFIHRYTASICSLYGRSLILFARYDDEFADERAREEKKEKKKGKEEKKRIASYCYRPHSSSSLSSIFPQWIERNVISPISRSFVLLRATLPQVHRVLRAPSLFARTTRYLDMESDNDHPDRGTCYSPSPGFHGSARFARQGRAQSRFFIKKREAPLGLELLEPSETDKARREMSASRRDRSNRSLPSRQSHRGLSVLCDAALCDFVCCLSSIEEC